IAGASPEALLELLQRPEYRYRYWAKRELRQLDPSELGEVLNPWIDALPEEAEHAQLEGLWLSRSTDSPRGDLVESLSQSESPDARAAATRQIRYLADTLPDSGLALLGEAATDPDAIVRTEAVIAASYLGSREALDAVLPVINQPMGAHLRFAAHNAFISDALEGFWRESEEYAEVAAFVESWDSYAKMSSVISKRSKKEIAFDSQENLATIEISCVPERMLYTVNQFEVTAGQPVKLVFTNPDATQHNLVIVNPGALEAVGMAGNEMAKDPNGIKKHFVPESDQILHASKLLGVDQAEVMRFEAPTEPGVYPYLCTFPGHWVIMKGEMVVKTSEASQ
ncbi:MAG: HEAT repeat domain-containing protein, partial [Verrucomicrobiota bacterium]